MAARYAPNLRVHEYVLEECIGAGAFGEVWRARHHVTSSIEVAIKLPIEPEYVTFLKQEGLIVRGLRHPNIVGVLGIDPYAEIPYLVMELVKGPSLRQVLQEHRAGIPIETVTTVLRGILKAMVAAHDAGVVHRDLKPANVLLHLDGRPLGGLEEGAVKVSDFGLGTGGAEMLVSIAQSASLNRDEQLVGTIAYMAPELRDGRRPADARSDLYSIGVMLFELLTGERPAGTDLPSTIRSDTPRAIDQVFRRLFTRYEMRYETAQAALDDLTAQLGGSRPAAIELPPGLEPIAPHYSLDPLTFDLGDGVTMELLPIQAGEFLMGAPAEEEHSEENERPQHRVRITKPFYMGKYPVTRGQWRAVMGEDRLEEYSAPIDRFYDDWTRLRSFDEPVDLTRFRQAEGFCERLSERVGRQVRLPTEAEWEYACRAGTTTPYAVGHRLSSEEHAHYDNTDYRDRTSRGSFKRFSGSAAPIGSYAPNDWGLYDMHGNVWEWCGDWFGPYSAELQVNPTGPAEGTVRVKRGGSWQSGSGHVRSAARKAAEAREPDATGFRVVIPIELSITLDLGDGVTMELRLIPPGQFLMGSPEWELGSRPDEGPRHRVRITKPFYMGKYPVTQAQWRALMGTMPTWRERQVERLVGDDRPMHGVSWYQCREFCRLLSKRVGRTVTLPTEAEWEYACRAGTTTPFNLGENLSLSEASYWPEDTDFEKMSLTPTGSFPPNAWGLHDMHGGIGEWCADWFGDYGADPQVDPTGPAEGTERVVRGGNWFWDAKDCRSASRIGEPPNAEHDPTGLRVVVRDA